MVDSHQSLYHHEVDELDEVSESLFVSVSDFEEVFSFLGVSSDEIHRFLFNLLAEFHFVLFFDLFQVALFVYIVLDFSDNVGHFSGNDGFILTRSGFSYGLLFEVKVSFFPCSVF